MSASFPSSSGWEPFGSSQQAHALGWRRQATRSVPPAFEKTSLPSAATPTPPFSSAAARWNQQTAARPAPPASRAGAAFRHHERDTKVLARYEAVRADIHAVDAHLSRLHDAVARAESSAAERHEQVGRELARLQGVCESVREDLRERDEATRQREKDRITRREEDRAALETLVQRQLDRSAGEMVAAVEDRVRLSLTNAAKATAATLRAAVAGFAREARRQGEEAAHVPEKEKPRWSIPLVLPIVRTTRRGRMRRPTRQAEARISHADDLYALRVANRPRPTSLREASDDRGNRPPSSTSESHQSEEREGERPSSSTGDSLFGEPSMICTHPLATQGRRAPRSASPSESDSLPLGPYMHTPEAAGRSYNVRSPRTGRFCRLPGADVPRRRARGNRVRGQQPLRVNSRPRTRLYLKRKRA